jgi:hypothetical protein
MAFFLKNQAKEPARCAERNRYQEQCCADAPPSTLVAHKLQMLNQNEA